MIFNRGLLSVQTDGSNPDFVFKVTTTASPQQISLFYTLPNPSSTIDIDYGDATTDDDSGASENVFSKTYATAGTYTITVSGEVSRFSTRSSIGTSLYPCNIVEVVNWGSLGLTEMDYCFYGTDLAAIPDGPMPSTLVNLDQAFVETLLTTIPASLFDGLLALTTMRACFFQSAITTIPDDLGNVAFTTPVDMFNVFGETASLVSVGDNFFKNSNVDSLKYGFRNSAVQTVGNDFLANNSGWITQAAAETFKGCSALNSIGSGIFSGSGGALNYLSDTFYGCTSLITLPELLDLSSTAYMRYVFYGCTAATTKTQDLWVDYPSASDHVGVYRNDTSLPDYASIPVGWR